MTKRNRTAKKNLFDGSIVFGTKKFNKKTKRDVHIDKAMELQINYFIDPKTGLLFDHMAEYRDCPICGSKEFKTIFVKLGFHHVKCRCGFIFVNPTASDKFRNHFFSEIYQTWTAVLLSPEQEMIDSRKFQYGIEIIESYRSNKGFIVDIGAGSGLFLKLARDSGWKVSAIEYNKSAVEKIKNLGIEVFDRAINGEIYAPDSVDVVTLWEVLEHINHPNELITQIKKNLRPGGLLFICVPNINALVTRILHEKSRTFGGNSHVNFFSIETLTELLKKHEFNILESDTAISEIGTIKNFLSYEDPYCGESSLEMEFLTPEYLFENNLGSRIFILAKKTEKV